MNLNTIMYCDGSEQQPNCNQQPQHHRIISDEDVEQSVTFLRAGIKRALSLSPPSLTSETTSGNDGIVTGGVDVQKFVDSCTKDQQFLTEVAEEEQQMKIPATPNQVATMNTSIAAPALPSLADDFFLNSFLNKPQPLSNNSKRSISRVEDSSRDSNSNNMLLCCDEMFNDSSSSFPPLSPSNPPQRKKRKRRNNAFSSQDFQSLFSQIESPTNSASTAAAVC